MKASCTAALVVVVSLNVLSSFLLTRSALIGVWLSCGLGAPAAAASLALAAL